MFIPTVAGDSIFFTRFTVGVPLPVHRVGRLLSAKKSAFFIDGNLFNAAGIKGVRENQRVLRTIPTPPTNGCHIGRVSFPWCSPPAPVPVTRRPGRLMPPRLQAAGGAAVARGLRPARATPGRPYSGRPPARSRAGTVSEIPRPWLTVATSSLLIPSATRVLPYQ